jgi:serine/threonine-protein kinase
VQGPTVLLGRYELHAPIAAGGMASVHLGRLRGPIGFARTVAIKRLHSQYAHDAPFVAMFVDEARLLARVQHPNVVVIVDVVHEDNELFLVMEYVHGVSLAGLFGPDGGGAFLRVPPSVAGAVFTDVLHGLHAAHEATTALGEPLRIVHRDATPHNILVGLDGTAKIADFGIATATHRAQHTRRGLLKGKLSYVAPEQLQAGSIGPWTDVYATAVSMWEALAGRPLFEAEHEGRIVERVLVGASQPPSAFAQGISRALDDVVMRGLALDPKNRFQSARDMAIALERAVAPAPASEIRAFVESRAGAALAERARLVRAIESTPSPAASSGKSPPALQATTTEIALPIRPRRTGWIVLAAAAVAAAALGVWARRVPEKVVNAAPVESAPPEPQGPPLDSAEIVVVPTLSAPSAPSSRRAPPVKPCEARRRDENGQVYYDRNCLRDRR